MDIGKLKQKILDIAIRGKLVPQNPNDEPASVLIEKIRKEREELIKQGKIKRDKNESYIYKSSDNCYYEKIGNDIKNITEELPFEIPNNWCWCRLKNLSSSISAGGDKPNIFSKQKTNECKIPVFSNGIEKDGLFGFTNEAKIFKECITISARGTIGFTCVRKKPFVPIVRLITIIPKDIIMTEYLKIVCDALLEKGEGTSTPQLTVPFIKEKLIPLPPIEEQYKIINNISIFLTKLNCILDDVGNLNILIDKAKNRILDHYFGDNSCYKSYCEKVGYITDDVEIFDHLRNPINFNERVARLEKALIHYPYYGSTGITGYIDDYIIDGEYVLLGEDAAPFLDKYANKAYIVKGKSWVNNHVHILKSKTNNKFLMHYLNWFDYSNYVSGTTRFKLSQSNMKKIPFPICGIDIKNKIVFEIDEIFKIIDKLKEQLT